MPISKRFLYRTVIPALFTSSLLAAFRLSAGAAAFVWDADSSAGSDGPQDGPGTWQTSVGNWFDSTNNLQNQTWANGNDAIFGAGSGAAGTVVLGSPITANSLTFNAAGSGSYTINGNTLTLTTGNITTNTAPTVNSTISSILAGSAGLTISGTGTVVLNGSSANTYTGKTTVSSGGLTLNKGGGVAAVTGDIEVDTGGTLTLAAANQIPDTATLTVAGGTVSFGGKNETIQNLTISGGSFVTGNGTGIFSTVNITGTVAISGGSTLTVNSGATLNAQSVTLTDASPAGGPTSGASILLGGNTDTQLVIGSGGLSMTGQTITLNMGAGNTALVLNGDLTASGTNAIKLGGLSGTGTNALAIGTATRTLNITGGTTFINVTLTGSSGNLIKAGTGNLIFGGTVANTYTGLVTVNAGTLTLGKTSGVTALAGDLLVKGGTLVLGASDQIADTSNITITAGNFNGGTNASETFATLLVNGGTFSSGSSNITITGNTTVTAGTFSGGANGSDTLATLLVNGGTFSSGSSNITISGNTTVTAGTFSGGANASDTLASLLLNGGTFSSGASNITITGNTTITGGISNAFTVNSGGTVSTNGLTLTGGGILIGGSSTTLTTLTIGSGGLSLTGQLIQTNAATTGNAGSQIILNGDLTARGTNSFTIAGTVPSGAVAQLDIGSASRHFNISEGATNMSLSIIGSGGSLIKQGGGLLALFADNTYSGATIVEGGTLAVSMLGGTQGKLSSTTSLAITGGGIFQDGSTNAANNDGIDDRINPLATLILGGNLGSGIFGQAFGTTDSSQTLASLSVQQGASTINTLNTPSGTLGLTFTGTAGGAGYARSAGGSVNFISASGYSVSFANAPTAAGGSSVSGTGPDAVLIGATLDGVDFIAAQAGVLTAATYVDTGTVTWSAGKNMNVTGNVTATAGTPINSLRFGTAGAFTISLTGMQTIDSGMILVNGNVGDNLSTISGGTLTGSSGGDLLILQYNTINGLTISSTIADHAGATALTIAGGGLVTLTGNNTYTGQTYLNGGTLSIGSNAALGAVATGAPLNFDGGTLLATTTFALANGGANQRNVVLNAGGGTFNVNSGATLTVGGNISGVGTLTKAGTGALLLSDANSFTGGTVLSAGVLQLGDDNAAGTGPITLSGGTLQSAGGARTLANALTLSNSSTVSGSFGLTINGPTTVVPTIFTLSNNLTSGSPLTLAGNVFLSKGNASAARQLTFVGSGATVISGVVSDNDTGLTPLAGVTFNGSGSLKLTGINTYTGRTITAGTGSLIVQQDANFGAAPSGPMTDSIILAQQGTLRVENGFTLNSNRNIGIGATNGGDNTGTIDVAAGQSFIVNSNVTDRTVNSDGGAITGTNIGSLRKIGSGTLLLAGRNTYSGNTTVNTGTLDVTGTIAPLTSGTQAVSVAGGATLQLAGSGAISASTLSLNDNSTFSLEVGTLGANTISLTDAATLTGTITLALNLTADPLDGALFTLIDGGSPLIGYSDGARFFSDGKLLDEGTTFHVTTGGINQDFTISYAGGSDGDDVTLQAVPAVPEPSTLFALGGATGLLLGLQRLRRRPGRLAS